MDEPAGPREGGGGLQPLDVLLLLMREKWDAGDRDAAANIAKLAAPYLHARAAATARLSAAEMDDAALARAAGPDDDPA